VGQKPIGQGGSLVRNENYHTLNLCQILAPVPTCGHKSTLKNITDKKRREEKKVSVDHPGNLPNIKTTNIEGEKTQYWLNGIGKKRKRG